MDKVRVLIVQQIVPHYRVPLFTRMGKSAFAQYTVAYGKEQQGSSLPSLTEEPGISKIMLHNVYYGKGPALTYQKGLLSALWSKTFDVVIAEFNLRILSNILGCFLAKLIGVKFIWWGHGIGPQKHRLSRVLRLFMIRSAGAIVFYDQRNADLFVAWGIPKEKVFVAWNSIDTTAIAALRQNWTDVRRQRILCIGRLIPEKKAHILIQAFAEAGSSIGNDVTLTIVGDGPESIQLKELAQRLGVDTRTEFTGALTTQAQLAPLFNSALVSVSPGYVGLNVIHSLAYGIPVVAADDEPHSPEVAALEDGKNARYFPANDSHALAVLLSSLLRDQEALAAMSAAARMTVQGRFSIESMADTFDRAVRFVR